jgi:hypothetical protein
VVRQVANRDPVTEVRELGDVLPDVVVDRQLPVVCQQQDRRGGELLGHRRHMEDRIGLQRHIVIEVRHAVGAAVQDAIVLIGGYGAAWRRWLVVILEDGVDAVGQSGISGRSCGLGCGVAGSVGGGGQNRQNAGQTRAHRILSGIGRLPP